MRIVSDCRFPGRSIGVHLRRMTIIYTIRTFVMLGRPSVVNCGLLAAAYVLPSLGCTKSGQKFHKTGRHTGHVKVDLLRRVLDSIQETERTQGTIIRLEAAEWRDAELTAGPSVSATDELT